MSTPVDASQDREALYLPNGKALKVIAFGYENAVSDLLWFNTINYFGKHYSGSRNYRWLSHMCTLVTDLNPRVSDVYEFCGSMLAWEAGSPQQAIALLTSAIERQPQAWLYPYLRGFFRLHFLNDSDGATADFAAAAKLPDCHPVVQRLAARGLARNDPNVAIDLLLLSIERAKDNKEKEALEERLFEAVFERDIRIIEEATQSIRTQNGKNIVSIEELATLAPQKIPRVDPWGNPYELTPDGHVKITDGRRRLKDFHRPRGDH